VPNRRLTTKQLDQFLENQQAQISYQQEQIKVQLRQFDLQEKQVETQQIEIQNNKEIALASIAANADDAKDYRSKSGGTIKICVSAAIAFSFIAFYFDKSDIIVSLIALAGAFAGGYGWNIIRNNHG